MKTVEMLFAIFMYFGFCILGSSLIGLIFVEAFNKENDLFFLTINWIATSFAFAVICTMYTLG